MDKIIKHEYYRMSDGIVRVYDIHDSMARNTVLIELDEYCGNFYKHIPYHWFLNNNNIIFEADFNFIKSYLIPVEFKDFSNKLVDEMNKTINEYKNGNEFALAYWRKTPERLRIVRKYYVK